MIYKIYFILLHEIINVHSWKLNYLYPDNVRSESPAKRQIVGIQIYLYV